MIVKVSKKPCYLYQFDTDQHADWGKYIDLKSEPDRSSELPEVKEWPAFGDFLRDINRCEAVRTVGCGLNAPMPDDRKFRLPFVEVVLNHPLAEHSPRAVSRLCDVLLTKLDQPAKAQNAGVELTRSTAYLPCDEQLISLRLWLGPRGTKPVAPVQEQKVEMRTRIASMFPFIVAALQEEKIENFARIAEGEMAEWNQKVQQLRKQA
jgi:hypothetical protein